MLRQITLKVRAKNRLQDAVRPKGVKLNIVDCNPFNKTGMTFFLELKGEPKSIHAAIVEIRKTKGVRQAVEEETDGDTVPLLVVLSRPAVCKASDDAAIVCLECPFNSETQPASWKFIARKASDFRQVLSKLEREGVEVEIEDVTPLERRATLTNRQKEIMSTAVLKGYFEYPRRINLTELSELVGVKPSTLSEILRSAERRIMTDALGVPLQEMRVPETPHGRPTLIS